MMLEATCGRCGETFVPESDQPDDLIHGVTELGDECGGTGTVDGAWYAPGEPMPCTAFGTGCGGTVTDGTCGTCGAVTGEPVLVTVRVSGKSMSTIEGSELYQSPELYTSPTDADHAAAIRAGIALNAAHGRRAGRGWTYVVELDVAAAEIVRGYCATVGETFAMESEPDTRADGRALLATADGIAAAIAKGTNR